MTKQVDELEESLAFARCYWQWGSEPETQYRLMVLAREVERLHNAPEVDDHLGSEATPRPAPQYPEF